ncbi:alanine racemase [Crateriforma conspicua]|uniref:alanine racemase n=1 Tax=Crateriforma conspicua TaxID=2527996 RepID=UPI001188D2FD|nr:alanine racemase [Crateriforma conspicua]QDV61936.1 D-threonine aldolase [Crateriforma conspicua]
MNYQPQRSWRGDRWSSLDLSVVSDLPTPALLWDVEAIAANLERMIDIAGGPDQVDRLCPHVKTHKSRDVTAMQVDRGIRSFKASTIAEAAMAAKARAADVLLAHPLVGPKAEAVVRLARQFPATRFAGIIDNLESIDQSAPTIQSYEMVLDVYIDVDVGMHRTGVPFGNELNQVRSRIIESESLRYAGLHVYDGHLHQASRQKRNDFARLILDQIRSDLDRHPTETIIVGGSPNFEFWAAQTSAVGGADTGTSTRWRLSPGTTTLWDIGYAEMYSEADFQIAAALLTRVISRPGSDLLCLDLGTKAIASEMAITDRFVLPAIPDATIVAHNEEHAVIQTDRRSDFAIGQPLIALPRHICPSVCRYPDAHLIRDGRITHDRWTITARDRWPSDW